MDSFTPNSTVVDSDVLLLSYLDKICLALTGELRRALACLLSEGEAI
jgi:hypothetical protein